MVASRMTESENISVWRRRRELRSPPLLSVPAAAPAALLVPHGLLRDRLECHGDVAGAALALGHDVEDDALGAAAEHGDGPEVGQAELARLRRRRRERLRRHGHRERARGRRRLGLGVVPCACTYASEREEGWGGGLVAV